VNKELFHHSCSYFKETFLPIQLLVNKDFFHQSSFYLSIVLSISPAPTSLAKHSFINPAFIQIVARAHKT